MECIKTHGYNVFYVVLFRHDSVCEGVCKGAALRICCTEDRHWAGRRLRNAGEHCGVYLPMRVQSESALILSISHLVAHGGCSK